MTAHLGFSNQQPTIAPVAPPPAAPPAVPTNTAAHPAPGARPIAAAASLLRDAAAKFEKHIASINPAGLSDDRLHREVGAFAESAAMNQITDAVDIATRRQDDADARVADIVAGLSPKGDVAQELRAGRTWARVTRTLDATPGAQKAEVARKLIANASDDELGVLLTELPSYLESQGTGTEWIESVVAEKIPELAAAKRAARKAAQSRMIVAADAERLRGRITNTVAPRAYTPVDFIPLDKYDPDR